MFLRKRWPRFLTKYLSRVFKILKGVLWLFFKGKKETVRHISYTYKIINTLTIFRISLRCTYSFLSKFINNIRTLIMVQKQKLLITDKNDLCLQVKRPLWYVLKLSVALKSTTSTTIHTYTGHLSVTFLNNKN